MDQVQGLQTSCSCNSRAPLESEEFCKLAKTGGSPRGTNSNYCYYFKLRSTGSAAGEVRQTQRHLPPIPQGPSAPTKAHREASVKRQSVTEMDGLLSKLASLFAQDKA